MSFCKSPIPSLLLYTLLEGVLGDKLSVQWWNRIWYTFPIMRLRREILPLGVKNYWSVGDVACLSMEYAVDSSTETVARTVDDFTRSQDYKDRLNPAFRLSVHWSWSWSYLICGICRPRYAEVTGAILANFDMKHGYSAQGPVIASKCATWASIVAY